MDCHALAFRQLPHQPKLFVEYLDHFEKVKSFYFHPPAMPAVTRAARKLDYPGGRGAEGTSILRRQNIDLGAGAGKLSKPGPPLGSAGAGVFGPQGGVFSGAGYSRFKATKGVQDVQEVE